MVNKELLRDRIRQLEHGQKPYTQMVYIGIPAGLALLIAMKQFQSSDLLVMSILIFLYGFVGVIGHLIYQGKINKNYEQLGIKRHVKW